MTLGVITVGVIKNGSTYLSHHLGKNDYWSEGEKQVEGVWIGRGAERLGLRGPVQPEAFESLRKNRHPTTHEPLTAREAKNRIAFFDIQFSAPKDVSVLALVGQDERVTKAFREAVQVALAEMERFAAVRERRGNAHGTEAVRLTANYVGALFHHDSSRELDPQLHAHAVLANGTWDPARNEWFALQPAEMMRASGYVRQVLYREIAGRLESLGYQIYDLDERGFSIRGVEHLRARFSKRAQQVQKLAEEFKASRGRTPTKREVEVMVRESRGKKLIEISTPEVRRRQRAQLDRDEIRRLDAFVVEARTRGERHSVSLGEPAQVLDAALRHVFERASVAREADVLRAALELHPRYQRWRELRDALHVHPGALRKEHELTLRDVYAEEWRTIRRVQQGRNTRFFLGDSAQLPGDLSESQKKAAASLLRSRDFMSVLIGDAGTGKTTVLRALQTAHRSVAKLDFLGLAPTTRSRDELVSAGFKEAETVQRFLLNESLQSTVEGRVILVDEAGLLSTTQLDSLSRIAFERKARLLLVGDTKQHYSVERGDALRNVIRYSKTPVVRLSEVVRQRNESDRYFSRLLAAGRPDEALEYAARRGMVDESRSDDELFQKAAEDYARNVARGVDTLVVIPFWDEIDRFNIHARSSLRDRGLLGEREVHREAVRPLSWTEQQKTHWHLYRPGDHVLFVRNTRYFRAGSAARVTEVLADGVRIESGRGRFAKLTARHKGAFELGRAQQLAIASGDRLLIRGQEKDVGFANGDIKTVVHVDPEANLVVLDDGKVLPPSFAAWTYGHALTSYRAQGSTAESSMLVMGEVAERTISRRQFYVANTRFRGSHRIYLSDRDAIVSRLATPDPGRELAGEFVHRQRMTEAEALALKPLRRMGERARSVWSRIVADSHRAYESVLEKVGL